MGKETVFTMPEGPGPGGIESEMNASSVERPNTPNGPQTTTPPQEQNVQSQGAPEEDIMDEAMRRMHGEATYDTSPQHGERDTPRDSVSEHERSAAEQGLNVPTVPAAPSPSEAQGQPHAQSDEDPAGPIQEHVEGEEPEVPETRMADRSDEEVDQHSKEKITALKEQTNAYEEALTRLTAKDATDEERAQAAQDIAALKDSIREQAKKNDEFVKSNWERLKEMGKFGYKATLILSVLYILALLYTTKGISKGGS